MYNQETKDILGMFAGELKDWQEHNFPGRLPMEPCLGIVEELGEYFDAAAEHDVIESIDALSDCLVFIADLCNGLGIEFFSVYTGIQIKLTNQKEVNDIDPLRVAGKICHSVLKLHQRIRTSEDHKAVLVYQLARLVMWIKNQFFALPGSPDTLESLITTWEKVRKRDWAAARKKEASGPALLEGPAPKENDQPRVGHGSRPLPQTAEEGEGSTNILTP